MTYGRVIRPAEYPVPRLNNDFFFLLGPNTNPPWQDEAVKLIHSAKPKIEIVCPCRAHTKERRLSDAEHRRLVIWELHFLREAWKQGIVLCWFPEGQEYRSKEPFAQNCRAEYGRSLEQHLHFHARIAVGIEPYYSGGRFTRTELEINSPDVKPQDSLAQTCQLAASMYNHQFAASIRFG